jgi:hypothetical protein
MADSKITSTEAFVAIQREALRGPLTLAVQKGEGSATKTPGFLVELTYATETVTAHFNLTEMRALRKWLNDNID